MICSGSGTKSYVSDGAVIDKMAICPICGKKVKITIPDRKMYGNLAKFSKHTLSKIGETMRYVSMKPMSARDAKILDKIFKGMESETSKRISNSKVYIPLSVERLYDNRYSMAHYVEQFGDLLPDPDIELYRDKSGNWYPVAIQQIMGNYTRAITNFDDDGEPTMFNYAEYNELRDFLSMWLKNLKEQQGL